MSIRPRIHHLILTAIFTTLAASTIVWTLADRTPPAWDPADHVSAAYDYYAPVARLDFREFGREFFVYPHYYAPFVHLVTAAVFLLFGASRLTGIVVNFISLAVLLGSVYWLSQRLYAHTPTSHDNRAHLPAVLMGILASLLATCYHFPAWLLHDAFLDYPLIAMVTLSFALLVRADDFRETRPALCFAVAAGCGMLTKQTFAFFFLLPAAYVTARVLFSRNGKAVLNLALTGVVIVAVSAIWYGPHLDDVMEIYRANQAGAVNENEAPLYSFMSNLFYVHGLLSPQMQLPFALLFVFGLIYSLIRFRKESVMLYLWLLSGIGAFSMVANKDLRYTVPVLPAAALLSVCWAGRMSFQLGGRVVKTLKLAPVAAIVIWALVSFFNAQYPREGMGKYIDTPRFRWMVFARNYFGFDHRPLPDDWSVPEIVQSIVRDWRANPSLTADPPALQSSSESITFEAKKSGGESSAPTVGVVVNLPHLNPSNVALYARLMTEHRGDPALLKIDWITSESAKDRLETCDYIVARTGLDTAEWLAPVERYAENLQKTGRFKLVATLPIPLKGAEAVIYRRLQ